MEISSQVATNSAFFVLDLHNFRRNSERIYHAIAVFCVVAN
jgi:hypothetical protein